MPSTPSDEPVSNSPKPSRQTFELVRKSMRAHQRRMRREKFAERNFLAWFFNELPPQDMYRASPENRRSTREEMRYHRLRQRTGWTFWSHLKSSTGLKFAAVAGLVSTLFQAAPTLRGKINGGEPFNWLLIAGLFYILAVVWFEVCCPTLLKQSLSAKPRYLGLGGRRWLQALVEDELRRWWSVRKWAPDPRLLDLDNDQDKTTLAIMTHYGTPAFAGFGVYACAHIEQVLNEFSQVTGTRIWRRDRSREKLYAFAPSYAYEGNRPYIRRLIIDQLQDHELDPESSAQEGDLVLEWFSSSVSMVHNLPTLRQVDMAYEAQGLVHLFSDDKSAAALTEIVAFWQDTMRPFRRLGLMALFCCSGLSFGWFVWLQLHTVWINLTL